MFGRPFGLKLFKYSKVWYMNGAFKVATILFCQVYVILVELLKVVHLTIYAFLNIKKEQTYQ